MLPTFVIGLREGLEAALIVGIIAAFLRKQGRRDLVRWVFLGVGVATLLCIAVGVTLDLVSQSLPQRKQEGLETVVGILAVAMVTYMVIWMRRHSRELKGQLEGLAADAMGAGGAGGRAALAIVAMAFLAVLREGFETAVFLVAAFNESTSGASAPAGAVLGIAVAVVLGYAIYRGGLRINLSKFFRATGIVLVLVAAGLVVNALHTAHEAGWLDAGQSATVDLTWLAKPGTVQASLLTGMLGIQPRPVLIELVGWLVYAIPVGLYVAWPPGRSLARNAVTRLLAATGAVAVIGAVVLGFAAPGRPAAKPVTTSGADRIQVATANDDEIEVRSHDGPMTLVRTGTQQRDGVSLDVYTLTRQGNAADQPAQLDYAAIARLNGGRLPIGLRPDASGRAALTYDEHTTVTVLVEPQTLRVVDVSTHRRITGAVLAASGATLTLSRPVLDATRGMPAAAVDTALDRARSSVHRLDRRDLFASLGWLLGIAGGSMLAVGGLLGLASRRGARQLRAAEPDPARELVAR